MNTMSTLAFEMPSLEDAPAMSWLLAEYWYEAWLAHGNKQTPFCGTLAEERRYVETMLEKDDDEYLRVAKNGGRLVGLLYGRAYEAEFDGATLDSLVVALAYRGQGVGSQLMKDFKTWLPSYRRIGVIPFGPQQTKLEDFYGRFGFRWSDDDATIEHMILERGSRR